MKQLFLSVFLALVLTACNSTPDADQNNVPVENGTGTSVTQVNAGGFGESGLPNELSDPKNILYKKSVYFDYDKYEINAEYKELISAHAKFLNKNRELKILVQGNTDDRGSSEYNLALEQKRADSLKKMLILFGAREEQLESVSLGKEKPKAEGQSEAAHAENRRDDMIYNRGN